MSSELPIDFVKLKMEADAAGLDIVDTVLEPVLSISVNQADGSLLVQLAGHRYARGQEQLIFALSVHHNYVISNNLAFPLPRDICLNISKYLVRNSEKALSMADAIRLKQDLSQEIETRFDPEIFRGGSQVADLYSTDFKVSPLLNASLYPYQVSGVGWLTKTLLSSGGLILADEMGLGKTVQVIATILELNPSREHPILIVCPTSLISNWVSEIRKFAPSLSVCVHRGSDRAGIVRDLRASDIILSTYDTVVIDQTLVAAIHWGCVICDEAQALKNPDSNRRSVISELKSKSRLLMTGTPVETSLLDMWSLLDLAVPGVLGSRADFQERYPDDEESASNLNALIAPLVLRRTVNQVAKDLPERIDIECPIELPPPLIIEYEQIRKQAIDEYGLAGSLVATTRLSVFCAHPALAPESAIAPWNDDIPINPRGRGLITPKMELTLSIIEEASLLGKKILVFSNYNRMGDLFRQGCEKMPINFWDYINGETPQEDRQIIIDEFSSAEGSAVLVLNPRAAGAGLNITAATIVIHYTPVWNPALEMQASARAHRRGQTSPVTIYSLFYEHTVEEIMIERARYRKALGEIVVPAVGNDREDMTRALEISPLM